MAKVVNAGELVDKTYALAPGTQKEYTVNFAGSLGSGETISAKTVTADGDMISIVGTPTNDTTTVTFVVAGHASNQGTGYVNIKWSTSGSVVDDQVEMRFKVGPPRDVVAG